MNIQMDSYSIHLDVSLTSEDLKSFLHDMNENVPGSLLRAARELLGWSQRELADRASCGIVTVQRIEKGATFHVEGTRDKIVDAIESAGIRFLSQTSTEGAGIRWATPADQPVERPSKRKDKKSAETQA